MILGNILGDPKKIIQSIKNFAISSQAARLQIKGLTDEEIRARLVKQGYNEESVKSVLASNAEAAAKKAEAQATRKLTAEEMKQKLIESGMNAKVLQKKLGHKKIETTLDTYTSVFSKFEDSQDDRYCNYLVSQDLMISLWFFVNFLKILTIW